MKINSLITSVLILASSIFASSTAQATVINFTGNSSGLLNLGSVSLGQTGTLYDFYSSDFKSNHTASITGLAFGSLPSDSEITFTYSFTGLSSTSLDALGTYSNNSTGHPHGFDEADTNGGHHNFGTLHGHTIAGTSLVLANAGLDTHSGTTTFINNSTDSASFFSLITGILHLNHDHGLSATYAVTSLNAVPLPASLPLFAAIIASLIGYSQYAIQRKKLLSA